MFAPSGDERNTIAFAISSAVINRRNEVFAIASSRTTSIATPRSFALLAYTASIRAPATDPGQIAFTRMPCGPSSIDSVLVKPMTPHFDAAYGARFGKPKRPAADERLAILALALAFSNGIARCAHRNC